MATHTTRDKLILTAFAETHKNGNTISSDGLANMTGTSERTARDVLKTLDSMGAVRTRSEGKRTVYTADEHYAAEHFGQA